MKNNQKGFIVPVLLVVIALLVIGGGVYIYKNKKAEPVAVDTTTQTNNSNSVVNSVPDNQKILNGLVNDWKKIAPSVLPGFPDPSKAFYGYPYTIQFIGKNSIVIAYQDDFNPLFAVLGYDSSRQQFSYLDGLRSSPFAVNETLWNTWRKKYGDISFSPQTFQFSSTRTGDVVYSSDWKLVAKNPFTSNNSVTAITVLSPNGGEKYESGKTYDIKWSSNSTKNVDIGLIEGSKESGQGAGYVALNIPNSGIYKWTIPSSLNTGQYRIFVRPVGEGSVEDTSNSTFTITVAPLTLTNSEALALVKATWGGCTPDTCSEVLVSVSNTGGVIYVTATYEGLRDDSSSASRKVAPVHYDYGYKAWVLETPVTTQRCQPGRGHQDFSSVLCN